MYLLHSVVSVSEGMEKRSKSLQTAEIHPLNLKSASTEYIQICILSGRDTGLCSFSLRNIEMHTFVDSDIYWLLDEREAELRFKDFEWMDVLPTGGR